MNFLINSSNVVTGSNNNQFTLDFSRTAGSLSLKNKEICLAAASIPFSWWNISSTLGNNSLSYVWLDGNTYYVQTTSGVNVLDNGYYGVTDLNNALVNTMISNGHYLIDNNQNNVYLLDIVQNSTRYSVQIDSYYYASLPSSWSYPSGASWSLGQTQKMPQLNLTNAALAKQLGFNTGSYPSVGTYTANKSYLSAFVPELDFVTAVTITCNLAANLYQNNSQNLFCFTPTGTYGDYLQPAIQEFVWVSCPDGIFSQITVQICDQNGVPISSMQDPTSTFMLYIRDKRH